MSNLSQLYDRMQSEGNPRIANFARKGGSKALPAASTGMNNPNWANTGSNQSEAYKSVDTKPPIKPDPNAYGKSIGPKNSLRPGFTGGMKQVGAGLGEAASYTAQKTKQLIMATSRTGKKFFRQGWKLAGEGASAAGNAAKSVGNAAMKNPGKTAAIGAGVAAVGGGGYYLANRDN